MLWRDPINNHFDETAPTTTTTPTPTTTVTTAAKKSPHGTKGQEEEEEEEEDDEWQPDPRRPADYVVSRIATVAATALHEGNNANAPLAKNKQKNKDKSGDGSTPFFSYIIPLLVYNPLLVRLLIYTVVNIPLYA